MMIKNECRHAYLILDQAECLWCENCVEALVKRLKKPKITVSREFVIKLVADVQSSYLGWSDKDAGFHTIVEKFKEIGVEVVQ